MSGTGLTVMAERKCTMTNPTYTHLTLVVDRSGSMADIRDDAQGGIATLLTEQFAEPGQLTVTMVEFDNSCDDVARMATAPFDYTLRPRGGTALVDAVGREITRTGEDLAALPEAERPSTVLFVVVTDGQENSSSEFTLETVRAAINRQRISFNWQFQFIGAGEAAWQGRDLDVQSTAFTKTSRGTQKMYGTMSDSMKRLRGGLQPNLDMPDTIDDEDDA